MLWPFNIGNQSLWRPGIKSQRVIINVGYVVLFSYLVLYSTFTTLYLDNPPIPKYQDQPFSYDIEDVSVRPISCTFTVSSQYQTTSRCICYLLLAFTTVIRNHEWLAAAAATSVMTYSGVAAIHLIVLFATNNVFHMPDSKTHCDRLPFPGKAVFFPACHGVTDPDVNFTVLIVSIVMLGALPMAALSRTFRKSTTKSILVFWLLLLAIGHTFDNLTSTNVNRHFQICRVDSVASLPGPDFQAPDLDQAWRDAFDTLVSTAHQPLKSFSNATLPPCVYSCFATSAYTGRRKQDIIVLRKNADGGVFVKNLKAIRMGGILFWWLYTLLAFLTLLTTTDWGRLPRWAQKRALPSCRYRFEIFSKAKDKSREDTFEGADSISSVEESQRERSRSRITVSTLTRHLVQLLGVVAFGGSIVYQEVQSVGSWGNIGRESFAAVGQWGNLVVVLLVLLAAVIRRGMSGGGVGGRDRGAESLELGTAVFDEVENDDLQSAYDDDEERDSESWEWDWRVGYAS